MQNEVKVGDAYNVVRLLLRLGCSFDDIAALGFYLGRRKLTRAALEVWYQAEQEQRKPITDAVVLAKNRKPREMSEG